jgi:translocator protein
MAIGDHAPSSATGRIFLTVRESLRSLIVFGLVTVSAATAGGQFTARGTNGWYEQLDKPFFNPPAWVFGPVWTVLYAAMALAAWLVWKRGGDRRDVQVSTALFSVQLLLNVGWSALFFGLRSPLAALIEIVVLFAAICAWYVSATRIEPRTRWLIAPYLAWVAFAGVLNASIWWMNR